MGTIFRNQPGTLLAIVLVYLALASGTAATRQPYADEGELASPSFTLVHRGYMAVTVWDQYRDSRKAYWMPPMFFLGQAAFQSAAGFGVIQLRLASVMWGLFLLLALRFIVDSLTKDRGLATAAITALAIDYTFLMHAGIGRCEMMSLTLAILSSAAYLRLRERSLAMATAAAHGVMTASALTHPIGAILWMPCLLGLQLWLDWDRRRWSLLAWMAAPYIAGLATWGVYIAQDPEQFRAQFSSVSMQSDRLAGLKSPVEAFRRELVNRFLAYYGIRTGPTASPLVLLKLILPVGYVLGLAAALIWKPVRRMPVVRGALLLFALQFTILAILEGTKQFHYIVHVIPVLTTILACGLWQIWKTGGIPRQAVAAAVVLMAAAQIGPVLYRIREDRYHKHFLPAVAALTPFVERGDFIVGEAEFAIPFGFPDNLVIDYAYAFGRQRRPDAVIADRLTFESNMEGYKSYKYAQYRYMKEEFPKEFEPVFEQGNYTIFKRRTP